MNWLDGAPILVPVDFFPCSGSALIQGARLAAFAGASLHVFHVVSPLVARNLAERMQGTETELAARSRQDALVEIVKAVANLPKTSSLRIEPDSVVGLPANEILKKADSISADLLVLGVSGAYGDRRTAGDTTSRCLKRAHTDVLIVREKQEAPFRTVLVGVDFSPLSRIAVARAARVAAASDGRLVVLHVFDGPWHRLHYRAPTQEANPDFERQFKVSLRARLEELVRAALAGLHVPEPRVELLEHRNYRQGLVEFASSIKADLVVLGTGTKRLSKIVFGSTAERVLSDFPGCVLVVGGHDTGVGEGQSS